MNFKVQSINRHRLATDGEGVTTLVALYGCPLSCEYCINKEVLHHKPWKEYTAEALLRILMQDYCYFVATNGGVTFGGGEPLLHAEAIEELFTILPEHVNLNLETSLCVETKRLSPLLEPVHQFIIDVKTFHPELYQKYTGQSNEPVIQNIAYIAQQGMQGKCKVRVPHIPDYTSEADVSAAVHWLQDMGFRNIDVFDYILRK
ncbi:MAG: radical SAM protein [Bacteroides sp.]|nr:radical SAM protein [Bacteroides sp.]MCM1549820.1 radical SAM protein [Clostridium sp.]